MAFSHVQGGGTSQTVLVNSTTVTLPGAPTKGNVVVVAIAVDRAATGITVSDSNSNNYTQSPSSPVLLGAGPASIFLFYLLVPANATATLTITWSGGTNNGDIWADEFSSTGGARIVFDTDKGASNTFGGATVNLPSLSVTGASELVYAVAFPNNVINAPTAGGTLGVWTGSTFGPQANTGGNTEYQLNATGAITPNFTDASAGDTVVVLLIAFFAQVFEDDSFVQFQPPPFDPIVSVW